MPAQALSIVVSKVGEREARQALRSSHLWGEDDMDGSGGGVGGDDGDSDDDYSDDDDYDGTPVGRVGGTRHHLAHRVVHLSGTRRIRLL